ncbi:flagellar protein FlaG [Shewanella frigidimarina]|uniref:Flagellar protein FlaG protein n=1 Tax=Shewanella frigidimarina (strain NCIMB 400) TaxID=318167 RepID=Q085N8_SHEFN|nr:flagellar protein FlaG [Shewanella frigidimarina]ABI71027.1 flagellar protein FlaG protein [Shewanella frigidimarina NCIMB 400]
MDNNSMGITNSFVSPTVTKRPEVISETLSARNDASNIAAETIIHTTEVDKVSLTKTIVETQADANTAAETKKEQSQAEALAVVVEQLSEVMSIMNKGLAFSIDDDSGSAVVKVMDIDTGELIRQIPNDEALELAQKLLDVKGLLMRTEA